MPTPRKRPPFNLPLALELRAKGWTYKEISAEVHRTASAVGKALTKMGVPQVQKGGYRYGIRTIITPEFIDLLKSSKSTRELCEITGYNKWTIYKWRKRLVKCPDTTSK